MCSEGQEVKSFSKSLNQKNEKTNKNTRKNTKKHQKTPKNTKKHQKQIVFFILN